MSRPRTSFFSPLTQKRWRQFRSNRRAWFALRLLLLLYGLSLGAELLCNDRPLLLRLNGRTYFPAFRFYSQHQILGNGVATRVDYARLAQHPDFARRGGFMLRAPVCFGPQEIARPEDLEPYRRVTLRLVPDVEMGRLNLDAAGRISRPLGCDAFFPGRAGAVEGETFGAHWQVTPELEQAVAARFANRAAPELAVTLQHRTAADTRVQATLVAFTPRATPPASVRLALKPPDSNAIVMPRLVFERPRLRGKGQPAAVVPVKPRLWRQLPETLRQPLLALAQQVYDSRQEAVLTVPWGEGRAQARCVPDSIAWPYRPVPGHWLGLDVAGRDVLARIIHGLRTSLTFGLVLVLWAMTLGFLIGATQGFFAGWVDLGVQRFIEIWSAMPFLYVMILVGDVMGRSFGLLLLCYGIFNWIGISYYMRAEFLRLRNRAFVEAARCQGISSLAIIVRHILPNALTPMITLMPFNLIGAVASITALDYLGFGLPPLTPSWGELLQQALQVRSAWWLIVYPSLMLFTVMILTVLIGEGLRDAFDPKPRTRIE